MRKNSLKESKKAFLYKSEVPLLPLKRKTFFTSFTLTCFLLSRTFFFFHSRVKDTGVFYCQNALTSACGCCNAADKQNYPHSAAAAAFRRAPAKSL